MFRKIAKDFRGLIALYAGIGLVCAGISAASVVLFQRLVDALTEGEAGLLPSLLVGYGVTWFLVLLLNYLEEYPHNQLYQGIYYRIKRMALEKVARIEYAAYQDFGTGQLVQAVESGATAGRDILFSFYLRIVVHLLPDAVVSVVVMGVYDARIMLGALSGYVVVFLITRLLLHRLYAVKEKTLLSEEWLSKTYVRAFMEMVVFRVNRRFAREIARVREVSGEITDAHTKIKMVHEAFFASFAMIVLGIKLILIATSVASVLAGNLSVGVLLALLTLTDRMYEPVAIFNVLYVDYKLNRVAWDRFMRLMHAPDDPNLLGGEAFALGTGHLRLEGVSFGYGAAAEVLRDVTLDLAPGRSVALVGRSGGGKSTLVKLVMGLVKPGTGRVLVDGQDLAHCDLNSYYRHIAYISQDTPIFDGTLRENICFDGEAADAELYGMLEAVQLADFVRALPLGLETPVGEHGVKLSGGEKQRLAFARVLYQRPAIIILDEPTSALDQETERQVMQAMQEAWRDATVLSIAHRLSTVRYADEVVVLAEGAVAERGTHETLLAAGGEFATLWRAAGEA